PAVTAGNVNRNVAPCTPVLTKTRPPCIPTVSYTTERLMTLPSLFGADGFPKVLKGRSNIVLSTPGDIGGPFTPRLKISFLSRPCYNFATIVPPPYARFSVAVFCY